MSLPFYFIYLSALCFRRQTATAVENSLLHFKFKLNNDLSAPRGFVSTQVQPDWHIEGGGLGVFLIP